MLQHLRGYLTTPASIAAGVPDETDLPRRTADSGEDFTMPCLAITGRETQQGGRVTYTLTAELLLRHDLSQLAAWQLAIGRRMLDVDALWGYLAALTEQQRTGWFCYRIARVSPDIDREPGDVTVRYAHSVELRCLI
jgi:hypothetical protein